MFHDRMYQRTLPPSPGNAFCFSGWSTFTVPRCFTHHNSNSSRLSVSLQVQHGRQKHAAANNGRNRSSNGWSVADEQHADWERLVEPLRSVGSTSSAMQEELTSPAMAIASLKPKSSIRTKVIKPMSTLDLIEAIPAASGPRSYASSSSSRTRLLWAVNTPA